MRGLAILSSTLVALSVAAGDARGESPDAAALVKQGLKLAKREDYAAALEKFRAADDLAPRTETACLIALTHGRMGQWGRAHIYYQQCQARSSAEDPMPDWSQDLANTIDASLAKENYARLSIIIEPPVPGSEVTVSAFPEQKLAAGRYFVPPGPITVTATAPGREPVRTQVTLAGGEKRVVELALSSTSPEALPSSAAPDSPADRDRLSRRVMWGAAGTAGAFLAGGIIFHAVAAGTRGELADAPDLATYEAKKPAFEFQRTAAIACYGLAAVSAAIGAYLYFKTDDESGGGVAATAVASDEAAMAQVIWTF